MQLISLKTIFIFLFFCLLLVFVGIRINKFTSESQQIGLTITNNDKDLKVKTQKTTFEDFDQSTKDLLKNNRISKITVTFTNSQNTIPNLSQAYDKDKKLVNYMGFNTHKNDSTLNIDLYISTDALDHLKTTDTNLTFDVTQQLLLAISDFDLTSKSGGQLAIEEKNKTYDMRFQQASAQAQKLLNMNKMPFLLSRQQQ